MKLLMPFWNLDILPRYMPQFTALAEHTGQLIILYVNGKPIPHPNIRYMKIEMPRALNRRHSMLRLMDSIHEQVEGTSFDIVYSLSGRWLQQASANISRQTDIPLVMRLRGDERSVARIQNRKLLRSIFFKDQIRGSFKQASLVIPIAEKLVKVARGLGAKHIWRSIPNGVNHTKFTSSPQPDSPTVGYVGRLSKEKGTEFLQTLIHRTPNVHYILAGDVHGRFHTPPNCDLLGYIPYKQIQDIYKTSSIILIPSLLEADPNARLEAYASARPIMITPEAHPAEAQLYGWQLPQNIESWARVLNNLRQNRLEPLGQEAYEYSKRFTWKLHGERMAAAIKTVHEEEIQDKFTQVKQEAPQPP